MYSFFVSKYIHFLGGRNMIFNGEHIIEYIWIVPLFLSKWILVYEMVTFSLVPISLLK